MPAQPEEAETKPRTPSVAVKTVVLKSHHPSMKERQPGLIEMLYGPMDLQCKSCGVRYHREEMNMYTQHLDWHFRVKRREKDNARRAQSRKWYFEKRDWVVSDEIEEQEETEAQGIEEQEEKIVIPTIPLTDTKEVKSCPVCREDFDQFFKQGDNDEEGGWYVHNAVLEDGVMYHPECLKDKDHLNNSIAESSINETAESEATDSKSDVKSEEVKKEVETEEVKADVKMEGSQEQTPIKTEEDRECILELVENSEKALPKEESAMDVDNNNVASSEDLKEKPAEESMEMEESLSANASLVSDGLENSMNAPVVGPQKVDIKLSFTSKPEPVERMESVASAKSEQEDSEFDSEAIVVPAPTEEEKDLQKPRLRGKRFIPVPPKNSDSDLSGLCSIM